MLPGRFVDRGGGAGLARAERGGRSRSRSDAQSLSRSEYLSLSVSRLRAPAPGRSGDALAGGDLGRLGMGEARGISCVGAGAESGVGSRAADNGVRGIRFRGAAEIGVRDLGGAAETGVRERGGAAETGVRERGGAADCGVRRGAAERGVRLPSRLGTLNDTDIAEAPGVLYAAAVALL